MKLNRSEVVVLVFAFSLGFCMPGIIGACLPLLAEAAPIGAGAQAAINLTTLELQKEMPTPTEYLVDDYIPWNQTDQVNCAGIGEIKKDLEEIKARLVGKSVWGMPPLQFSEKGRLICEPR